MPLTDEQIQMIIDACNHYDFPAFVWDGEFVELPNVQQVEEFIHECLADNNAADIRKGLASVVSWGWGNTPLLKHRTQRTLDSITEEQIKAFINYRGEHPDGNILQFAALRLPQLNRMAFGTKVLAFMKPERRAVLDKKIVTLLQQTNFPAHFGNLTTPAVLRISHNSAAWYDGWCQCCMNAATQVGNGFRAVDVERAIFKLLSQNNVQGSVTCVNQLLQN